MIENQMNKKIKVIRMHNGQEFCNKEFNRFCEDNGIIRYTTIRFRPKQNEVAERTNKTLLHKVRCMLSGSDLGKSFWGEAVATTSFLVNISPNTTIDFKTP